MHNPHIRGMNGDIQSNLVNLKSKNGEQLEGFHSRIIRLQQEINLSGETVYHPILLIQYTKELSNINKAKALFGTNMRDLITFIDNNVK